MFQGLTFVIQQQQRSERTHVNKCCMSAASVYSGPQFWGRRQEEKGGSRAHSGRNCHSAECTQVDGKVKSRRVRGGGGVSGGRAGVKWH